MLPSVIVADDNSEILIRVATMLDPAFDVVAVTQDGNSTVAAVDLLRPDVVVLDISMGQTNGIDLARRLRSERFRGKIVFLTVHDDPEYVSAALGAGATGYVTKASMANDLVTAIQESLADRTFVSTTARPH